MRPDHDPPPLTPEERFHALAALLAAGLRRRPGPRKPTEFLSRLP
jgi:hypothetical protein